jgi:hypothetical protein
MAYIVERKNWGRKTRQKVESEKTRVYAQKSQLKMPFKNSISGSLGVPDLVLKVFDILAHEPITLISWYTMWQLRSLPGSYAMSQSSSFPVTLRERVEALQLRYILLLQRYLR